MTTTRRVVIDTDPGIDDAMAIAVAVASPDIELVALTTVFGNHRLDVTTANAIRVLDHLGVSDVPVVAGADRPLLRELGPPATFVHGDDGLGDIGLPRPSRPPVPDVRAATYLVDLIRRSDGDLTIATIGPLTNLALALRLEPDVATGINQVVAMGGAAFVPGNVTPAAEANIWNDPEAAEIVFRSGLPITMIGLDVTHQLVADLDWLAHCGQMGTLAGDLVHRTAPTYVAFHRHTDGLDGIHCHDVATIAYLLRPDLFETRSLPVRVATNGVAAGATVVAARHEHGAHADPSWADRPLVEVGVAVEAPAVLDLVCDLLART